MKKLIILVLTFCIVAFVFTVKTSAQDSKPTNVSIGTSSMGSTYYTIATGMSSLLSKYTEMKFSAQTVGGSAANARAINAGIVDLGMLNSFCAKNAFQGTGPFVKEGKIPIRLIAQGQKSLRQIVVRADEGIESVSDLQGKKLIAKRKALPEIELVADAVLSSYGVNKDLVTYIETAKTGEAIDALIAGTVDGAVIPGGVPAGTLTELTQSVDIKFLSFSPNKMKQILKKLGSAFSKGTIPAGTYKGQDQDIYVPALKTTLCANKNFSKEAAYSVTKALFEHQDEFKLVHSAAKEWTVENSLKNIPFSMHPGAVKYYKEIGAWTDKNKND